MRTKLFIFLAIFLSVELYAQEVEDNVSFDPKDTIYLPHFGQNVILDDVLDITMRRQNDLKVSSIGTLADDFLFNIPIKIWVYRNDDGSHAALNENDVYSLLDSVNKRYAESNTSIQFYMKCGIEHVNSTQFNMNISNDNEFETS